MPVSRSRIRTFRIFTASVVAALIASCVAVLAPSAAVAAVQLTYYVAPSGNDDGPGTLIQPFATVERARQAVAENNGAMTGDIVVYLRGGTYTPESPVTFTESDSASNGHEIIYRAYPGESPVISGGVEITEWEEVDSVKHVYRAPVPTGLNTRELYVDGVRAIRARGEQFPAGFSITGTGFAFNVPNSSTYATMATWGNPSHIQMTLNGRPWQFHYCGVNSITSAPDPNNGSRVQGSITMEPECWNNAQHKVTTQWAENARELLDAPREWYLDRGANYLYYIPSEDEDLATASVVAPKLESFINVTGADAEHRVEGLVFQGLTFAYSTWLRPSTTLGYPDLQGGGFYYPGFQWGQPNISAHLPAGAVAVQFADRFKLLDSTMKNMGGMALSLVDSAHATVSGSRFVDMSYAAVNINRSTEFNISNNYFARIGLAYHDAIPLSVGDSSGSIEHNEIQNVGYSGIGRYGTGAVKIRYNYIHDYLLHLNDGGAIYTNSTNPTDDDPATTQVYEGDEFAWNYADQQGGNFGGIYFDDGSREENAHHNVVNNAPHGFLVKGTAHKINSNFFSTGMQIDYCNTCAMSDNLLIENGAWPQAAIEIMQGAGLESSHSSLRETDLLKRVPHAAMTATATSEFSSGYVASSVLDDSLLTIWHSKVGAALPQSITLSLGDVYSVKEIEVTPRQSLEQGGNITKYRAYTSLDGVTFTQIGEGNWPSDTSKKRVTLAAPSAAGFVKLEVLDGVGGFASAATIDVVYDPDPDLGGVWKFNEAAGVSAADSSGLDRTAALHGGGSWVPGVSLNGRLFNGSDAYAHIPDAGPLTAYTVSMWVNPLSASAQNLWVRTSSAGSVSSWSHQLRINSAGKFEAYMHDGVGKTVTGTTVVALNTWYHVALTASNGGQLKLYVNGIAEGSPVALNNMWPNGDRYQVGSISGGGFGWFRGTVDQAKLYKRALSSTEVASLHSVIPDRLAGHWKLDEASGTVATDSSRAAVDGTIAGGATWGAAKVGNGLSFNGTSTSVTIPSPISPAASSVSMWVRLNSVSAQSIWLRTDASGPANAWSHQLRVNSSGQFEAYVWDGIGKKVIGTTQVEAGEWYHLTLTAARGGQLKLYVDGLPEGTPVNLEALWAGGDRYRLGASSGGGFGWFNGMIDDVRLVHEQLSDADVYNQADPLRGLTGYWPLDEGSGTSAADTSGYHNAGAVAGVPDWVQGTSGKALKFNGSDLQAAIPGAVDPVAYTVSLWVRPEAASPQNIWVRTSSAGGLTAWSHQLRIGASGKFEAYMFDGGHKTVVGTTSIETGQWYHLVLTASNGGQLKLFVNGQQEGTAADLTTMWQGGDRYQIGGPTGGGLGWLNGVVDETKLFHRALAEAEITRLYETAPVNVALAASITASTSYSSQYEPANVADRIVSLAGVGEWASEGSDAWIQFSWSSPQTISKVVFFDRRQLGAWAPGGTLEFSDGPPVSVSGIPDDGSPLTISFSPRQASWVKFTVSGGTGYVGLSEMQVF